MFGHDHPIGHSIQQYFMVNVQLLFYREIAEAMEQLKDRNMALRDAEAAAVLLRENTACLENQLELSVARSNGLSTDLEHSMECHTDARESRNKASNPSKSHRLLYLI